MLSFKFCKLYLRVFQWSLPRPRPNEEGGKYFSGIISQYYKMGNVNIIIILKTSKNFF